MQSLNCTTNFRTFHHSHRNPIPISSHSPLPPPIYPVYVCVCVCACMHVHKSTLACSLTQSCLTLCDLMDHSPPACSIHVIFPVRYT